MGAPSALLIRLPKYFGRVEARAIDAELDHHLLADHPCVVVDFSRVKQIDSDGLHMLLGSMVTSCQTGRSGETWRDFS